MDESMDNTGRSIITCGKSNNSEKWSCVSAVLLCTNNLTWTALRTGLGMRNSPKSCVSFGTDAWVLSDNSSIKNFFCMLISVIRINNQQDASSIQNLILSRNSTCFGHLLCPSSGVISCARGNWYISYRLCGRCLGESGWNSVPTWP
jgi:hypothetical protein